MMTLASGTGASGNVTVIVSVSDQYGSKTAYALQVCVTNPVLEALATKLEAAAGGAATEAERATKKQEAARDSLLALFQSANSSISTVSFDGDREAAITAVSNAALDAKRVLARALGEANSNPRGDTPKLADGSGQVQALLGPLFGVIGQVAGSNATTPEEALRTVSAIAALSEVVVRASGRDMQAKLLGFLSSLLDSLDPCTDFDTVRPPPRPAPARPPARARGGDGRRGAGGTVGRVAKKSLECAIGGSGERTSASTRLALLVARLCFTDTSEAKTIMTNSPEGADNVEPSGVTIPKELRDLGQSVLGVSSDSLPFKMTSYLRSPYVESPNATSTFNISSQVVNIEIPGVAVTNLTDPVAFRIPLLNSTAPVLPLSLVYFNTTSLRWMGCNNISLELVGAVWYAVSTCNHLTPFAIAVPPPTRLTSLAAPSTGVPGFQTPATPGEQPDARAAIAVPVAVGATLVFAGACCVHCFVLAARRRRRRRDRRRPENAVVVGPEENGEAEFVVHIPGPDTARGPPPPPPPPPQAPPPPPPPPPTAREAEPHATFMLDWANGPQEAPAGPASGLVRKISGVFAPALKRANTITI